MKKVLIATLFMVAAVSHAADVSVGGWYTEATVGQVGLWTDAELITVYLSGGNLPSPQWVTVSLNSDKAKCMLAVLLTAKSLDKKINLQASPLQSSSTDFGVCALLNITLAD